MDKTGSDEVSEIGKIFQIDSPFMRAMSRIGDLIWLNILFVVLSVPIFTIGASYSAMNAVLLAIMRKEEGYVTKTFFTSFKKSFKRITPLWIGMLFAYLMLVSDLIILIKMMSAGRGVIFGIICVALFFLVSTNLYAFALIVRFENTARNTLKNAFVLSVSQLFITIMMLVDIILPFAVLYYSTYFMPIAILFGFSGPAFINAFYFNRLFERIEKNMMKKNNDIIFLQPVLKENCWGGKRLSEYGYSIPSDTTGEAWVISAHPNGDCVISAGEFKGMTLSALYESNRELFGDFDSDRFPLLIKIIDAREDLSIQVHPDDDYAAKNENNSLGKTECWYILDCKENASIVIGHNAKTEEEMKQMIKEGRWTEFIREIPVKKGDFFQINPGCLHAIKGGTMILETQQNSDITYRVYDYDRLSNGEKRELHIERAMDVIKAPYIPEANQKKLEKGTGFTKETLIECKYYKVCKFTIHGEVKLNQDSPFVNVSVLEGNGKINNTEIKKGDNFILPSGFGKYGLSGDLSLIISSVS